MYIKFISLACAFLCLTALSGANNYICAAEQTEFIELELDESVVVSNKSYTLGELIVKERSHGRNKRKIGSLVMGVSPKPGYIAHLTRAQIAARLEEFLPGIQKDIHWKGAAAVKVNAEGVHLAGRRLEEAAGRFLEGLMAKRFNKYSFAAVGGIQDLVVPKGELKLAATLGGNRRVGKRTCVWIDIYIDGDHYQTVPVWFDVKSYRMVLVVNADQKEREHINVMYMRIMERDVAGLPDEPLDPESLHENMRFAQTVKIGQVVTRSMLEPVPAVEKGDLVTVHAQSGRVRLRTKAIAMADADVARRVSVRDLKSGQMYTATVLGQGEVTVDVY